MRKERGDKSEHGGRGEGRVSGGIWDQRAAAKRKKHRNTLDIRPLIASSVSLSSILSLHPSFSLT